MYKGALGRSALFGDDLRALVLQGIEDLKDDAGLLRTILGAVEGSQTLLEKALLSHGVPPEGHEPAESTEALSVSDHLVPPPGGGDLLARSGYLSPRVSIETPEHINSPAITISGYALRVQTLLTAAKVTGKDSKLNILRVAAPAAGGIIRLREVCDVVIDMNLCTATRENFAKLPNQANEEIVRV